jgi:isopenicillin N synthase-like dioxygenase
MTVPAIVSEASRAARAVPRRALPVFDVGQVRAGDVSAARALARPWAKVCESLGFMCIVNHGVPSGLIARMEEQARRYHDLPLEVKMRAPFTMRDQKGYAPARFVVRGKTKFNVDRMVDTVEAVVLATDYPADDPRVRAGKRFYVPTVWPPAELVPEFRATAEAYMAAITALGKSLLPVWSLALDLEPGFFGPRFAGNYTYFRIAKYPAQPDLRADEMGVNAHADTGFMTFLPPAREEGLQILDPDGNWFWPELPKDALIVNTGQFLERWTNDRFRATPHRVVPPIENDRYSLACFVSPNFDASGACLPSCAGPAIPPKYPAQTYWEFFDWYQNTGFSHDRMPAAGGA